MMAIQIPAHARANFERTDDALHEIKGIVLAYDALQDAESEAGQWSRVALSKDVLLRLLIDRLEATTRLRAMEWVGQGGNTEMLTPDENALARGEGV